MVGLPERLRKPCIGQSSQQAGFGGIGLIVQLLAQRFHQHDLDETLYDQIPSGAVPKGFVREQLNRPDQPGRRPIRVLNVNEGREEACQKGFIDWVKPEIATEQFEFGFSVCKAVPNLSGIPGGG